MRFALGPATLLRLRPAAPLLPLLEGGEGLDATAAAALLRGDLTPTCSPHI